MQFFGIISLLFGILVISYPQLIAYILGFFFVFLGTNILVASWMLRRSGSASDKSWKFGAYEITRRK